MKTSQWVQIGKALRNLTDGMFATASPSLKGSSVDQLTDQ